MQGRTSSATRRRLSAALLGVLLLVAFGCRKTDESSAAGARPTETARALEQSKIRIGILAVVDAAPLKLAERKGFLSEQGLEAEIKLFQSGPQALPALVNGDLDFVLINYVSFFQAVSRGVVDGRIVAPAYQATQDSVALLARPGANIKTPADLAGKKVSVHQKGNIVELLLKASLQANGVDPNAPSYLEVRFPDIITALATNQIDAGVVVEPYITLAAQKLNIEPPFPIVTGVTGEVALSGYVATSKFISAHPQTLAAFQRALRRAQQAATDRAELAAVLPELTGTEPQAAAGFKLGIFPPALEPARLERVLALMRTYGYLPEPLGLEKLLQPLAD